VTRWPDICRIAVKRSGYPHIPADGSRAVQKIGLCFQFEVRQLPSLVQPFISAH
jgi:hypothetical protein